MTNMKVDDIFAIRDARTLTPEEKLVAFVVASRGDHFATRDTLQADTRLGGRRFRRAIRRLKAAEILSDRRRYGTTNFREIDSEALALNEAGFSDDDALVAMSETHCCDISSERIVPDCDSLSSEHIVPDCSEHVVPDCSEHRVPIKETVQGNHPKETLPCVCTGDKSCEKCSTEEKKPCGCMTDQMCHDCSPYAVYESKRPEHEQKQLYEDDMEREGLNEFGEPLDQTVRKGYVSRRNRY